MKQMLGKILVYLFGAAFIAVGIFFWFDHSGKNIENPITAEGVIIDIDESLNTNTMLATYEYSSFRPVILFLASNGGYYRFIELYAGDDKDDYKIGGKVDVIYNSENPEEAKMKHPFSFFGEHLILIGLGLLIIFIRIIV